MDIASNEQIKPMQWQDLCCGSLIEKEIEANLALWWPRIFGYHFLKLGPLSSDINTLHCQINHHFSLYEEEGADVQASHQHLPLQNNSIDAVLMANLLEYEQDPYRVLRESDRVLVSGGYIFIIGFNPVSPTFIGKLLPKYQTRIPWNGQFFMPSRVKDWMGLLGYQVLADERMVYHHLLSEPSKSIYWQKLLAKWLPSTGSLYFIVARKLDCPLTPTREKQSVKTKGWATAPTAGRAGFKINPNNIDK
ncbi:class I SAM-dependent methyltransferase [Shewanella aestuarii]|uniref:Class I SAM-dependent methyltransferase n=1 Tax=Shewanella aestuarii TaxID=1028752 RepID=A0A6G9QJ70_9GAMM|nr:class I SAM-dependent methyltransferase [Shewanella aestuarii]QIR14556.1 class I SAM-dependent methyltransferase [Shewanella aestuarii]